MILIVAIILISLAIGFAGGWESRASKPCKECEAYEAARWESFLKEDCICPECGHIHEKKEGNHG